MHFRRLGLTLLGRVYGACRDVQGKIISELSKQQRWSWQQSGGGGGAVGRRHYGVLTLFESMQNYK